MALAIVVMGYVLIAVLQARSHRHLTEVIERSEKRTTKATLKAIAIYESTHRALQRLIDLEKNLERQLIDARMRGDSDAELAAEAGLCDTIRALTELEAD